MFELQRVSIRLFVALRRLMKLLMPGKANNKTKFSFVDAAIDGCFSRANIIICCFEAVQNASSLLRLFTFYPSLCRSFGKSIYIP